MRYVIYSPPYHEDNGGAIAMHKLCDLLNKQGHESVIYPFFPQFNVNKPIGSSVYIVKKYIKERMFGVFETNREFCTPVVDEVDIDNDIAIYPEIVYGNPLGVRRVVRWLMNRPGFFTGRRGYGGDDLFFYYQSAFLPEGENFPLGGELKIIHLNRVYKDRGNYNRQGSCYLMRKGKGRNIVHNLNESRLIDGLSHAEVADIFNSRKIFISYDLYTMYSRYAAVCGCLSVVVPDPKISKKKWRPEEELRWGIAYGFDDIDWALSTQHKVLPYLIQYESNTNLESLNNFLVKTKEFFGF